MICRNEYPKTLTVASRKEISQNFNSVIVVCKRQGDESALDLAERKNATLCCVRYVSSDLRCYHHLHWWVGMVNRDARFSRIIS